MRPGKMVIIEVTCEDLAQMALVEDEEVVQTLAAYRTDDPLDVSILPGERGAVMTSTMPIASTRRRKFVPYEASRSRSRQRAAVSHGNASVTCCESQLAVRR